MRRFLDDQLPDALRVHPALLVVGPRASGKTTSARRYAASIERLDRLVEAAAFEADADAALATMDEPVLLDEWQAVPEVLGAVKRAVDDDCRPGRFLLTGSVRADLDAETWPAPGVDRKTAAAYERLLANLFVLDVVPAWLTNRLSRLVKTPKRYIADPALIGAALRMDARAVMRDGGVLGRVLDTFVAAQIRPEAAVSSPRPRLFHLREKNGCREVDLLAEIGGDRVVAIEAKASAAPRRTDAAHLEWLRHHIGERSIAGVVLHWARRPSRCPVASPPHRSRRSMTRAPCAVGPVSFLAVCPFFEGRTVMM